MSVSSSSSTPRKPVASSTEPAPQTATQSATKPATEPATAPSTTTRSSTAPPARDEYKSSTAAQSSRPGTTPGMPAHPGSTRQKSRESFRSEIQASRKAKGPEKPATPPADPQTQAALDKAGITGEDARKVLGNPDLAKNIATAYDSKKPVAERVAAGLGVAKDLSQLIPKEKLEGTLGKMLPGLPAAKELASMAATFTDPEASTLDKAKSVIGFGAAAKESLGEILPKLGDNLKKLDGPLGVAENALTLIDPNASLKDKAVAGVKLFGDAKTTLDTLKELKQPKAKEIGEAAESLKPGDLAPKSLDENLKKNLNADVAKNLTDADAEKLNALAKDPKMAEDLNKVAKNVSNPDQMKNLISGLSGQDASTQKAMLQSLGGMDAEKLGTTLTEKADNGKALFGEMGKLVNKLPEGSREAAAKALGEFDTGNAKSFMKFAGDLDPKILGKAMEGISKVDAGMVGKAFGAVDGLMSKFGVKASKETAEKVFGAMGKMFPALGAGVAAKDALDMAKTLADSSLPGEIRYLGGVGTVLNGADAALGVAEAFGIGNVGLPANIGLGVAELGLDLAIGHMKEQHAKGEFNPSEELRAGIGASAILMGPAGLGNLVTSFGVGGSVGVMKDMVEKGGEYAGKAAEMLAKLAAEGFKELAGKAGEAAAAAAGALKDLGDVGVNALKDLAGAGGELAEKAAQQLGNFAKDGVEAAKEALKGLGDLGKRAFEAVGGTLDDIWGGATGVIKDVGGFLGIG